MNQQQLPPQIKTDQTTIISINDVCNQSDALIASLGNTDFSKPKNAINCFSSINELQNTLECKTQEREQAKKQRIETEQKFAQALKQLESNNKIVEELKDKHQAKIKELETTVQLLQTQHSTLEATLQKTSSLKNWLTALGIVNATTIALLVWLWHYTKNH